ncbi:MAG: SIMPL domain-containing protein [Planctomycetes bacterium]|nr:SIMPL domain-containing protein [Planctomycetota bacterium]
MRRFAAALPAVLCLALLAHADDPKTITVHGKGTARAKPDVLVVTFHASGKAEKAADAVAKLKEKLTALKADLESVLKEKGAQAAKVVDSGLAFPGTAAGGGMAQMMVWNGGNPPDAQAAEVSATSEVRVTVPGVDAMKNEEVAALVSALLDKGGAETAAGNCGLNVFTGRMGGASSPVHFTFSDIEAAQSKAWDEAVKKARARAETIASRLGLVVGGAVKVRDLSDGDAGEKAAVAVMGGGRAPGVSSGEAELSVELEVEFELTKADKK